MAHDPSVTTTFPALPDGNEVEAGDFIVGYRGSIDTRFQFPSDGIKDANSNYLFKYASAGVLAVNHLTFSSALTGFPAILSVDGTDIDIDLQLSAKGAGQFMVDATNALTLPVGTNAQRPAGVPGDFRYNSDINHTEYYNGTAWTSTKNSIFRASLSGDQVVPSAVATKVVFDDETIDTNSDYDATLYRFTPTVPGHYRIDATISWLIVALVGGWTVSIYKNGAFTAVTSFQTSVASNPGPQTLSVEDIFVMNGTTDYVEIFVTQNTGVSQTVSSLIDLSTFKGARIIE